MSLPPVERELIPMPAISESTPEERKFRVCKQEGKPTIRIPVPKKRLFSGTIANEQGGATTYFGKDHKPYYREKFSYDCKGNRVVEETQELIENQNNNASGSRLADLIDRTNALHKT